MKKQKYYRFVALLSAVVIFQIAFASIAKAQETKAKAELSVAGIELGNREKAKAFLSQGYSPRVSEDGRPAYYFYNEWGSQVMKLIAASFDDPDFITEIQVFAVGESYQQKHYQADKIKYFETENNIFIGFKQSAMYFIAAAKNVGSRNIIGPKDVIQIVGEPGERIKKDEKHEVINYNLSDVKLPDENTDAAYQASYEFYKKNLSKFTIKIILDENQKEKLKISSLKSVSDAPSETRKN